MYLYFWTSVFGRLGFWIGLDAAPIRELGSGRGESSDFSTLVEMSGIWGNLRFFFDKFASHMRVEEF